jgi:hypothetical protein
VYYYNNDPNHGLKLDQLENHAIPSFFMDVVLKSSGELLLCVYRVTCSTGWAESTDASISVHCFPSFWALHLAF